MQFEGLYNKLTADQSAGNAEISSDPAYMEMQVALEGKAGSQMGDSVIAPQPPDYNKALEICTDLLGQARHVSLFVSLSKAAAGKSGFQGLAGALSLSHSIFSEQWDVIHPEADKDDPDDPWWERKNLLTELTDNPKTLEQLFDLELVSVRHIGAFSKRDIDIASGRKEGTEEEKERCNANLIRGAFTESSEEDLKAVDGAMSQVIDNCAKLDSLLSEQIGADAPSFANLKAQVQECQSIFREYAGDKLAESEQAPELNTEVTTAPESVQSDVGEELAQTSTVVVNSTVFADRESVARAFDSVMLFYQEFEPSSPVPILLFRARQMVHKNFFDILRELAPQHQDNFREIMTTLKDDPLNFLLEHSFNGFMKGERFEIDRNVDSNQSGDVAAGFASQSEGVLEVDVIKDRSQVVQTLKDIQKFFEVHEPSSPVPLIVQKVRNLVPKNFMDLLAEFESVVENKVESGSSD